MLSRIRSSVIGVNFACGILAFAVPASLNGLRRLPLHSSRG